MLVDINEDLSFPEFKLELKKRNGDEISELGNAYNIVYDHYFAEIDELTFSIPYYILSNNHDRIKNPNYDLLKGDFMIDLNGMYYFIIDDVSEVDNEGELHKEVHCYSREYELVDKKIRGYKFDARKIYVDPLSGDPMKDDDDFYWGILNYIETLTTWRVDYVNSSLLDIYRGFDISDDNLISIIQQLQTKFDCLFQFDTVNKEFSVYKLDELGQNKGLYISDENYIQSLTKNIKHDEIKTRLYLYGKDNISVEDLNLTGQPYVENFDFYKTTEYMSQDLIDELDDYETFLGTKESEFAGYLSDLDTYESQLGTKQDELVALQEELAVIQQDIDIAISNGDPISSLNDDKDAKELEISNKQDEIDLVQADIDATNLDISNLRDEIDASTYFTTAQLEELDPFIKYQTYSDSSYIEETKDELLEYGLEMLNQISQPSYEFDIDSVDFLSVLEAQHDWEKLVVGDIVNLKHTKINDMIVEVRLVHYEYSVNDKELVLEFSNRNNINDPYTYNRDLLKKLAATSTSVDFSKYGWDEAPEAKSAIDSYIDSELDLARQTIIQGSDQSPILDDRGLWLRKRNPDGTYQPEQIRAVNNVIALTEDNWDTVSTALTPEGLVAEKVFGTLGAFVEVQANSVVVGDGGELLSDDVLGEGILREDVDYTNGVRIDSTDGIVVTRSDELVQTIMNATDGIKIESRALDTDPWNDKFYVDTSGDLQLSGNIFSSIITGSEIISENGNFRTEIKDGKIYFKDTRLTGDGLTIGYEVVDIGTGAAAVVIEGDINDSFEIDVITNDMFYGGWRIDNYIVTSSGLYINPRTEVNWYSTAGGTGKPGVEFNIDFDDDSYVSRNEFNVTNATKNAKIRTEEYGDLFFAAYETAEVLLGTVGIDNVSNGSCTIHIDDEFKHCANIELEYYIILTPYDNGSIYVSERTKDYFIVSGDDIEFYWEIKAKRRQFEDIKYKH